MNNLTFVCLLAGLAAACSGSTDTSAPAGQPADSGLDQLVDAAEASTPVEAMADAPPEVLADSASDSVAESQPADTGDCLAQFAQQIAPVIDGLLYLSESDYPFEIVSYQDAGTGEITAAHFVQLLGADAGTLVEQRTFDEFFTQYLLDSDPRYAQMRTILESQLTNTTVIRVGEIQVHVFLVGRNGCGQIAGLTTISIET